jgi:hypothetical protein
MSENPYDSPRVAVEPPLDDRLTGREWLARENARAEVRRLLGRGVVFSIIWIAGFGSAFSIYCANKAHRIIRRHNGELPGMLRIYWCYLVGGFGVLVVCTVITAALVNRYF